MKPFFLQFDEWNNENLKAFYKVYLLLFEIMLSMSWAFYIVMFLTEKDWEELVRIRNLPKSPKTGLKTRKNAAHDRAGMSLEIYRAAHALNSTISLFIIRCIFCLVSILHRCLIIRENNTVFWKGSNLYSIWLWKYSELIMICEGSVQNLNMLHKILRLMLRDLFFVIKLLSYILITVLLNNN